MRERKFWRLLASVRSGCSPTSLTAWVSPSTRFSSNRLQVGFPSTATKRGLVDIALTLRDWFKKPGGVLKIHPELLESNRQRKQTQVPPHKKRARRRGASAGIEGAKITQSLGIHNLVAGKFEEGAQSQGQEGHWCPEGKSLRSTPPAALQKHGEVPPLAVPEGQTPLLGTGIPGWEEFPARTDHSQHDCPALDVTTGGYIDNSSFIPSV